VKTEIGQLEASKTITALEAARLEIEGLQKTVGSASDYLDRGRPGPEDKDKAEAFIKENKAKAQALEAEFKVVLQTYRVNAPVILADWVQTHLDTLAEIIAETEAAGALDISAKTRIHAAEKTAAEWQEVLDGKRGYVSINIYHLQGYYAWLATRLPGVEFFKIKDMAIHNQSIRR